MILLATATLGAGVTLMVIGALRILLGDRDDRR